MAIRWDQPTTRSFGEPYESSVGLGALDKAKSRDDSRGFCRGWPGDGRPLFSCPRGQSVGSCVVDRMTRALSAAILIAAVFVPARAPLAAQRQQEFTQQGLLVSP